MSKIEKDVGLKHLDEDELALLENAERRDRNAVVAVLQDCIPGLSSATLRWIEDDVRERRCGEDMCALFCYYTDVLDNPKKGFALALEASDYGSDVASYHVGEAHRKGEGVAKDFEKALEYYVRADKQGLNWNEFLNPLVPGGGDSCDPLRADACMTDLSSRNISLEWWLYVLKRKPTPALKYCLGLWYWSPLAGCGWETEGQEDKGRAIVLFSEAAESGSRYAMCELAEIYASDRFWDRDKALIWFRLAEAKGEHLGSLSKKLGVKSQMDEPWNYN